MSVFIPVKLSIYGLTWYGLFFLKLKTFNFRKLAKLLDMSEVLLSMVELDNIYMLSLKNKKIRLIHQEGHIEIIKTIVILLLPGYLAFLKRLLQIK